MRALRLIAIGVIVLMSSIPVSLAEPSLPPLAPMPLSVRAGTGEGFRIDAQTCIVSDPALKETARQLAGLLAPVGVTDKNIEVGSVQKGRRLKKNSIVFELDKDRYSIPGSYRLSVSSKSIRIEAGSEEGAFYALQTLRQLLPASVETPGEGAAEAWTVPPATIRDQPALQWRGLMLDCSRHFMDVPTIERVLDAMALLKMNRFHWHLIDSNGWRLQIDKYPLLTEKSAWRGPAKARYGGFYTKDDVRAVVAYAQARHIEVVPEFEMPGHSDAALMAYPEYSCLGTPYQMPEADAEPAPYDSLWWAAEPSRPLCAGNDAVFKFIEDVFDESLELFPYPIWHVGGDERPEGHWDKCPKCQARMKALDLPDEHALQLWFMRRVSDILARRGKTCISWAISSGNRYYDPLDLDDLGNGALVMNWHGTTHFACTHGVRVVNAATGFMYQDYPPFPMYAGWRRPDWMAFLPMEKMYSFDPIPEGLTRAQAAYVVGAQTCVWTEFLPQEELLPWIFPRTLAAAEAAWLPAKKRTDFDAFQLRVQGLEERFARLGIAYGHPVPGGDNGANLRKE